ncbi:MAG: hypothetical protein Q3962_08235, partial [Corynebacterium sp.]|nr:hypothetical protein [Corynebacterium sp.]
MSTATATDWLYAGAALAHKLLGPWLKERMLTVATIAALVRAIQSLPGYSKAKSGAVLKARLDWLYQQIASANRHDARAIEAQLKADVRAAKNRHAEEEKAREAEAYALRRAEFARANPDLMPVNPPPQEAVAEPEVEPVAVPEPTDVAPKLNSTVAPPELPQFVPEEKLVEPFGLAHEAWLSFSVKRLGPNNNQLILEGVPDLDTKVIQKAVSSYISTIPVTERPVDSKRLAGKAAMALLRDQIRSAEQAGRIQLVVVIDEAQLRENPDWVFHAEGETLDPLEIANAIERWGDAENLVVVDVFGRTVSYSSGRFSPSSHRMMNYTMQITCAFPDCGKTHNLQAHHMKRWIEEQKSTVGGTTLVCPHHHGVITHAEDRFHIFRELGTSAWQQEDGTLFIGMMAHPGSTLASRQAKRYGVDISTTEGWAQLRAHLVKETYILWNKLGKDEVNA